MLEFWLTSFVLEALLYARPVWVERRFVAGITIVCIAASTVTIFLQLGWWLGLVLVYFGLFRMFNLARIVKNRMHAAYLYQVTTRTSFNLLMLHTAALLLLAAWLYDTQVTLQVLMWAQLVVAAGVLLITSKAIHKLGFRMPKQFLADNELPTVTVAIPARNETTDLEECLRSVIANDYPKLEIIVLDDCSQGKTADIIRSFAQDGVRFVPGEPPAERWLAKNQAYQQLTEEASGDIILFLGVDSRLGPSTIRCMVNMLHARNKSMLSVLPVRRASHPAAAIIQPMRYWWELALPRRLFNKPPVLSTCWMISRDALQAHGGFKAVSHAILPEIYFARELVKTDQYSFVRSSNQLDMSTVKSFSEQYETAIRTRYPQIRRRPEIALVLTLANGLFLLLPFAFLIASFWAVAIPLWLPLATCVLLTTTHVLIVQTTDPSNSLLAAVTFPVDALVEMVIGYISMVQYEFFTVEWKGRNICIPVMHVIPKLPDLPER